MPCNYVTNINTRTTKNNWRVLHFLLWDVPNQCHSVHWGINPPPLFFTKPLNLQAPFLGISPLYIGFLWPPPLLNIGFLLKIGLFSEPQKFKVLLFPPVTSINVKITHKTCWLLLLTLLPHWCKLSKPYLVPVPNYWTWIKANTEKSVFSGQILIKLRLWSLIS